MRQYAGSPEQILKNASGDELAQLMDQTLNAPGIAEAERGVALAMIGHEVAIRQNEPFERTASRWWNRNQNSVKSLGLGLIGGLIGADLLD